MNLDALAQMTRGTEAARLIHLIDPLLDDLERRTIKGVMHRLDGTQKLSAEQALAAWYELFALYKLKQHMHKVVNSGKGAAAELPGEL